MRVLTKLFDSENIKTLNLKFNSLGSASDWLKIYFKLQKRYPDLGDDAIDASSVWNCHACYTAVISRANFASNGVAKLSAVFSG